MKTKKKKTVYTLRMIVVEVSAFIFLGLGLVAFGIGIYKFYCHPVTKTILIEKETSSESS